MLLLQPHCVHSNMPTYDIQKPMMRILNYVHTYVPTFTWHNTIHFYNICIRTCFNNTLFFAFQPTFPLGLQYILQSFLNSSFISVPQNWNLLFKNRHNFIALESFRGIKKDVSFTTIRVSTPRLLRSPFGGPTYLPLRRRLWMVPNKNWLRELHRETFHNSTSCNRCKNRHISNKTNKISTWVAFLWYLVIINHNQCKYLNGLHIFFQSMIKVYGAQ